MVTKERYLEETEHAMVSFFNIITEYQELAEMSVPPIRTYRGIEDESIEAMVRAHEEWLELPENREAQEFSAYARDEYRSKYFSMYVTSGTILQTACKGIDLFSENNVIESEYDELFDGVNDRAKENVKRYCIGREVNGVPIGLIIYAGRNQYNHIEAGSKLTRLNKNIFNRLASELPYTTTNMDPGLDLTNPALDCYSANIRHILGWNSYESYKRDMKTLLGVGDDES